MESRGSVFVLDGDLKVQEQLSRIAESAGLRFEAFATADEVLGRLVHEHGSPCCLVVEVNLPGQNGIELQETLNSRQLTIPVIFMTSACDIHTAVRAIQLGALNYMQKPVHDEKLLAQISHALCVSAHRNAEQSEKDAVRRRILQLSRRERNVFELLANGKSNKQISVELGIGVPMVTRHRSKVFHKLGVCNIIQFAKLAGSFT